MSGRLVAANTVTSRSCSMPSISVRSWARTRSPTPPEPEELRRCRETEDQDGWRKSKLDWYVEWFSMKRMQYLSGQKGNYSYSEIINYRLVTDTVQEGQMIQRREGGKNHRDHGNRIHSEWWKWVNWNSPHSSQKSTIRHYRKCPVL